MALENAQSQEQSPSQQMAHPKQKNNITILVGIFVILVIVGIGYYLFRGTNHSTYSSTNPTSTLAQSSLVTTANQQTTTPNTFSYLIPVVGTGNNGVGTLFNDSYKVKTNQPNELILIAIGMQPPQTSLPIITIDGKSAILAANSSNRPGYGESFIFYGRAANIGNHTVDTNFSSYGDWGNVEILPVENITAAGLTYASNQTLNSSVSTTVNVRSKYAFIFSEAIFNVTPYNRFAVISPPTIVGYGNPKAPYIGGGGGAPGGYGGYSYLIVNYTGSYSVGQTIRYNTTLERNNGARLVTVVFPSNSSS